MGIASLVLGIISIIVGVFATAVAGWFGIIIGIIGIILGAIGKKKESSCAIGGLVCSVIGTILSSLFYVACAACVGGMSSLL